MMNWRVNLRGDESKKEENNCDDGNSMYIYGSIVNPLKRIKLS